MAAFGSLGLMVVADAVRAVECGAGRTRHIRLHWLWTTTSPAAPVLVSESKASGSSDQIRSTRGIGLPSSNSLGSSYCGDYPIAVTRKYQ
jgi:hypothetical protein